ncbi:hypothetical protein ACFPAF_10355 [Hymenobacter endophyticus]|uniref:Uncharacterized protein n=1 Tax=Hymenobacter endophyticus TaxID=3076335 RepID=A0ABU3THE8_9BACT|nr:hypothetical protein [Hymenobacter endophyticus]MDU0370796.1 hypothetical protein [Hymenobacter endophyticus]
MKTPVTICLTLSSFIHCAAAFSQSASSTVELKPDTAALQQQYNIIFTNSAQLYNGPEYADYSLRFNARIGHQFYMWPDKQPGTIVYNKQYYSGLLLAYDIVVDQVVLSFPNSPFRLRAVNEKVDEFTINNHHFIRVVADSTTDKNLSTGYYELLTPGSAQVLAKRSKHMQKQIRQNKVEAEFSSKDKFFLKHDGRYYAADSKASILRAFPSHSKEMQMYIQSKKLKFNKKTIEYSLITATNYYNELSNK